MPERLAICTIKNVTFYFQLQPYNVRIFDRFFTHFVVKRCLLVAIGLLAVFGDRVWMHLKPGMGQRTLSLQRRPERVQFRHRGRRDGFLWTYNSTCHRRYVREHQWCPAPQVRRHRRHGLLRSATILPFTSFTLLAVESTRARFCVIMKYRIG